jgi:acetyl/propionyl-CoA carboxylase alpha subunit
VTTIEERSRTPSSLRKDSAADRQGSPFGRVLIANRGEIAVRVIRACRELGCETVAVFSDADRDSAHVRLADYAVRIGPAPALESYLRADAIVEAALATHAEAVHPGYGFLSERAPFADACLAAGLVFVGPSPSALAGLGDKLAARRAAASVNVAVVPGTLEPATFDERSAGDVARQADDIGFPLLVKAAAGGGGRGMRRVDEPAALLEALAAASREAAAAFGDGSVYLERYITGGRHVEVQLLGDEHGGLVALGERDCSIQRRHQKLLEEAPAPGLTPSQRVAIHAGAVSVARAVGLVNAATAEFLWHAETGEAWFLEVNARLQVEHGVTELVTGVDLVQEQLWIAAGASLSPAVHAAASAAAEPERHAIEVRISAEDPSRAFAPVPGTIGRWREPAGPGVRMDGSVGEGTVITGDYDPLLAKLLVVAPDRAAAAARLRRALGEFEVGGVQTTLPFHNWLLEQDEFRDATFATDYVDRVWDGGALRQAAARRAASVAARAATATAATSATGPTRTGTRKAPVQGAAASTPAPGGRWRDAGRRAAVSRWRA